MAEAGLPVGAPAPAFELEDIDGRSVSLGGLLGRGHPLLLVFSDAGCSSCREVAPDLARWQRDHVERLTVAVVASGGADANRSHARATGLRQVLLQFDGELRARYLAPVTPSAVLIAHDGTVASPVATGPDAIRDLAGFNAGPTPAGGSTSRLDDVAKAIARPVGRRRALAILAGAFAGLALPSLRPRRAYAGPNEICPFNAPTSCECSPETANCFQSICPPGYRCCWQACTDPNGCTCPSTYCCPVCDPEASQCNPGFQPDCQPGPIPPECCGANSRLCGNDCCPTGQDCCNGKCCPPDTLCVDGECREGDVCTGSGNRIRKITVGNNTFDTNRPLFRGETLEGGDLGTTYEMENGTRLRIAPGGSMRVGDDCFDDSAFEEFVGKIWANVKKTVVGSDQKFQISGPRFIVSVRGTSFSLDYDPAIKRAKVKVTSGSVVLRGRGKARGKVIVRKGEAGIQQGNKPPRLAD